MTDGQQYTGEIVRLRGTAAQSRLLVIEAQLALAFTLCAVAETDIRYGHVTQARNIINKIQRSAESIRLHLDEPGHVPAASIAHLLQQLTQLETRAKEAGAHLKAA